MNVIYWSDYACPFCYIGAEIIKKAFASLHTDGKLHLIMKSFELDPTAPRNVATSTPERFARKYGMTAAQASARIEAISEIGREAGIDFRYASTKYTSTLDAHRITKLAQDKYSNDTAEKLSARLYDAYFTRNLELSNHGTLIHEGINAGLSKEDIRAVLESNSYEADVRNDEK